MARAGTGRESHVRDLGLEGQIEAKGSNLARERPGFHPWLHIVLYPPPLGTILS